MSAAADISLEVTFKPSLEGLRALAKNGIELAVAAGGDRRAAEDSMLEAFDQLADNVTKVADELRETQRMGNGFTIEPPAELELAIACPTCGAEAGKPCIPSPFRKCRARVVGPLGGKKYVSGIEEREAAFPPMSAAALEDIDLELMNGGGGGAS